MNPGEALEVQKFIPVQDTAKMKEMEEQLEKEKLAIRKEFEKQRAKIDAKAAITDEERNQLLKELDEKQ